MLKQFKEFAFKGNLVDMAVGFILGAGFAAVVKSLVANVIMPPLGLILEWHLSCLLSLSLLSLRKYLKAKRKKRRRLLQNRHVKKFFLKKFVMLSRSNLLVKTFKQKPLPVYLVAAF